MRTLTSPAPVQTQADSRWIARAQDAVIFASCTNLFSTALANIGLAVFLLLFVKILLGPERRSLAWGTFPRGVALALAVYLGWQVVGAFYTPVSAAAAWEAIYADRKFLYILPIALLFGGEAARRRFLAAFMIVNSVALVFTYVLIPVDVQNFFGRLPIMVLRSHITQGMSFALACFLSLWYATQAVDRRWRAFFIVLSLAFLVNIVLVTTGRSGYVVFLVLVAVTFGLRRGPKGLLVGLAAAVVIALGTFYGSATVRERVMLGVKEASNFMTGPEETSLGRRMLLYHTTLEIIAEHPVLGAGTGSYRHEFSRRVANRYSDWKAAPFHDPHNQYLFSLAENGIVGLATFLLLLAALYRACDKRSVYGQMAAACLLAWCATSLFSGHFRTFPEGHMIVFILGVLMTRLAGVPSPRARPQ